jgi:anion-transporting  ArsA/GET3 family ATPase
VKINTQQATKIPQIIYVTGKGGVGKSMTAMLIGEALASIGKKCILVEVNDNKVLPHYYEKKPLEYEVLQLVSNLYCLSISPEKAIHEYLLQQLKFKKIVDLFTKNKVISPLLQNAPGLHDAVQLGKIYSLAEQDNWEHVIVDGPATGHGEVLLDAAKTLMDMTQVGPMYQSNKIVDQVLRDKDRCRIVVVSLLEQMVVQETCQLLQSLQNNPDRREQVLALFINRYQEELPCIEDFEMEICEDDSMKEKLSVMNQHIVHHNDQVFQEKIQMNRIDDFVKVSLKNLHINTSLHVPILADEDKRKSELYSEILSVLSCDERYSS